MNQIAQDPEGAKLVQAAKAQGLQLRVGNLPPGTMGEHQNGVITISPQAMKTPQDLIHTLAHELGHAATRGDGDSVAEEKAVDALGQRIQQRIAPGNTYQLDVGAYNIQANNGIANSLRNIGL
jgi:predicted Zn-dependent protease